MGIQSYYNQSYPTPSSVKGICKGKSALIIASGPSTSKLLKHKDKIKSKFDVIIGLNRTIKDFEDIIDYHMVMEKNPRLIVSDMEELGYRKDLTRVLNYKSIKIFPKDIPIIKARREYFSGKVNLKSYKTKSKEGLLEIWSNPERNAGKGSAIYSGTVSMQAFHFACILGCKNIYMIGVDLFFNDADDHYYGGKFYRDGESKTFHKSEIIQIPFEGKNVYTSVVFYKSAKYFDSIISKRASRLGINVFDFSGGLIEEANKVIVNDFFM